MRTRNYRNGHYHTRSRWEREIKAWIVRHFVYIQIPLAAMFRWVHILELAASGNFKLPKWSQHNMYYKESRAYGVGTIEWQIIRVVVQWRISVQYKNESSFFDWGHDQPISTSTPIGSQVKYTDRSGPKSTMIRVDLHTLVPANQTRMPHTRKIYSMHIWTYSIIHEQHGRMNESIYNKHKMHKHAINVQFLNLKLLASINHNSHVSTHSVINSRPIPSHSIPSRLHVLHLRSD